MEVTNLFWPYLEKLAGKKCQKTMKNGKKGLAS